MDPQNTKTRSSFLTSWRKLLVWVRHHKKASAAICTAFIVLIAAGTIAAITLWPQDQPIPTKKPAAAKPQPAPQKYYSPLTGKEVADDAATKANVTAVIIENTPSARPQSGLQQADIVYEAIAEAGITRFAAIYQQDRPELIGPVRSLRPYFIDWIAPYDASVAHVGGSLFALQEIRNGTHRDIDQFHHAQAYWRATDRYAPHNVYTSFGHLDELNTNLGYANSAPQQLHRQDTMPPGAVATSIQVAMSSPTYNSSWHYDPEQGHYLRSQASEPHVDREHGQITSEVVVVIKTAMDHVMEDGLRESYHTSGTGEAIVFAQGMAHEVTWHKEAMRSQLSFTSKADGQEFKLPRGSTWFSVVPANQGGTASWQ